MPTEARFRLTLAYLERRPAAAARVLQDLDTADAAALLTSVPVRVAALVMSEMPVWAAARCTELVPPERAGAILRELRYQDATSVLRQLPATVRGPVLAELPQRLARDFRRSLAYPRAVVGAWMDHGIPSFPPETRVGDVLTYARRARAEILDHVFVVDGARRYVGSVSLARVLRAGEAATLRDIVEPRPEALSNRAAIHAVAGLTAWDHFATLPVTGRTGNLLGGLRRASVREALEDEGVAAPGTRAAPAMVSHLLAAFVVALAELARLAMGTVEPDRGNPS